MNTKFDLSVIIPVINNAEPYLAALLSRLNLNQVRYKDIKFEIIVVDRGCTDNCRELCATMSHYIPLKYVYIPHIKVSLNYLLGMGIRIGQGKIIGQLHVNHWPSENVVKIMLESINKFTLSGKIAKLNKSMYNNLDESDYFQNITNQLLRPPNFEKKLVSVIDFTCPDIEIEADKAWAIELYIDKSYYNDIVDESYILNTEVFDCDTLPPDSFSIIGGIIREPDEHLKWLKDNYEY